MPLPVRHQRFVDEFLVDLNGTQAAIRAGYEPATAKQCAYKLRSKPQIKREIDKAMAERSRRTGISADRVLREMARLAFSDIRDTVEWSSEDGATPTIRLKNSNTISDDAAAAILEVTETRTGRETTVRVKLCDKFGPLKILAQHTGIIGPTAAAAADEDIEKLIGGDEDPEIDDRGEA